MVGFVWGEESGDFVAGGTLLEEGEKKLQVGHIKEESRDPVASGTCETERSVGAQVHLGFPG